MIVEPLREGADVAACQAIDRASFPSASVDFPAELGRTYARVWVARGPSAAPVGFLVAWVLADDLEILTVATAPEARRQGAGRSLVARAIDEAQRENLGRVLLEVRRSNAAAIGLYGSLGFEVVGERRGYYSDPTEDALLMNLDLSPPVLPHGSPRAPRS